MSGSDEMRHGRSLMVERVRSTLAAALPLAKERRRPFVTLTYAQSLDGSIARSDGAKLLLSNEASQALTHELRALHDAILVGINTVVNDNPRLNVRLVDGSDPQPVVVDTRLRFPLDASLLRDPCIRPIIFTGESTGCETREKQLVELGARVIRLPLESDGSICLERLLACLLDEGHQSVMVEGGGEIITSILAAHLADQFLLTIAPRFVGGLRAVHPGDGSNDRCWPELSNVDMACLAGDLVVRGDLVGVDRMTTSRDSERENVR